MTEYNRKTVKAIFENAGVEIPPKDVLTELCDLHLQNTSEKDEKIKELQASLAATEQERDGLREANGDGYKKKYEDERKAFNDYKKTVADKEVKTAKENAARAYFESKNYTGKNLELAMKVASAEIAELELEDGKIKDTAALDALVSGVLAGHETRTYAVGAQVAHPPANTGSGDAMTKADIFKIKDTTERQKAIAANLDLFRKGD